MYEIEIQNEQALATINQDFKSLHDDFLKFLGRRKSANTISAYSNGFRKFLSYLSAKAIINPSEIHVSEYLDKLSDEGKSSSTIALALTSIKTFFEYLAKRGIYSDITENVEAPEVDRDTHKRGFLTEEQETELLSAVNGSRRDFSLIFLMLTTGLRCCEIASARIEDIKEEAGERRLHILGKGRKDKTEFVKIAPEVWNLLEPYIGERKFGALFLSESNRNTTLGMTPRSISRIVKNALKAAGLNSDTLTAHSLRHTAAVQNLNNGGTLEETRGLLRHKSESTTRIYTHDIERARNQSESRLASALTRAIKQHAA